MDLPPPLLAPVQAQLQAPAPAQVVAQAAARVVAQAAARVVARVAARVVVQESKADEVQALVHSQEVPKEEVRNLAARSQEVYH